MKITDSDLFLVNRDKASFKMTGYEFKHEFGSIYTEDTKAPDVASVVISETNPDNGNYYKNKNFRIDTTMNTVGIPSPTYQMKSQLGGVLFDVDVISDDITLITDKLDNGVIVSDGNEVSIQGQPYNSGSGEPLGDGDYYKFFDVLNYVGDDGRTALDLCTKIFETGDDGYGHSNYYDATESITGSHQRTFVDGRSSGFIEFEMDDAGEYYVYAGDNNGFNTRVADVTFVTAAGTSVEEKSSLDNRVCRIKFTITTPGTVRLVAAGSYVLYFYATTFDRQQLRQTLTLSSDKDLDKFVPGDEVKMTDASGNDVTVGPQTDEIIGITTISETATTWSGFYSDTKDDWNVAALDSYSGKATTQPVGQYVIDADKQTGKEYFYVYTQFGGAVIGGNNSTNGYGECTIEYSEDGINWFVQEVVPSGDNNLVGKKLVGPYSRLSRGFIFGPLYWYITSASPVTVYSLNLDGNKDLDKLKAGDVITQDSGHTPETDVITNVGLKQQPEWSTLGSAGEVYASDYPYSASPGQPAGDLTPEYGFDGELRPDVAASNYAGSKAVYGVANIVYWKVDPNLIASEFGTITSLRINTSNLRDRTKDDVLWINGVQVEAFNELDSGASYGNDYTWIGPTSLPSTLSEIAIRGGRDSSGRFYGIEINGTLLVDLDSNTELTFATPKDIENFRQGDVVQGSPVDYKSLINPKYPVDNIENAFDGDISTFTTVKDVSATWWWQPNGAVTGSKIRVYVGSQDNLVKFIFRDAGDTGRVAAVSDNGTDWYREYTYTGDELNEVLVSYTAGKASVSLIEIDGKPLIDLGPAVPVISTAPDDNKMVVDGGTWSNGETVTGPDTLAPTTTVTSVDSASNTLTLSGTPSSPQRWIVNAGKFVLGPSISGRGKFASYSGNDMILSETNGEWVSSYYVSPVDPIVAQEADLYIKFRSSGGTNYLVEDLLTEDPGYMNVADKDVNLIFPSTINGKDVDTICKDGTYIQSSVQATNVVGSDSATSATYTPDIPQLAAGYITDYDNPDGLIVKVASDYKLGDFVVGDKVKMTDADGIAASYIPVTDKITSITPVDIVGPVYSDAPQSGTILERNGWELLFNGLLTLQGAAGTPGNWDAATLDLSEFNLTGVIEIYAYSGLDDAWGFNGKQLSASNATVVSGSSPYRRYRIEDDRLDTISTGSNAQLLAVYVNDEILIDSDVIKGIELTFASPSDIDYFRPGDLVGIDTTGKIIDVNCTTGNLSLAGGATSLDQFSDRTQWFKNVNDRGWNFRGTPNSGGAILEFNYFNFTPGETIYFCVATVANNYTTNWQLNKESIEGDILETFDELITQPDLQGTNGLPSLPSKSYAIFGMTPSKVNGKITIKNKEGVPAGAYDFYYGFDFVSSEIDLVSVISTDAANNKMTVDGGQWKKNAETDVIITVDDAVKATTYDLRIDTEDREWLSAPVKTYVQADAYSTGNAVGANPGGGPNGRWLYFDLKVESGMSFGRIKDDNADCQGILYGSNDGTSWTFIAVGPVNRRRTVTGSGYRYYAWGSHFVADYSGHPPTKMWANSPANHYAFATVLTSLEFATDKDLNLLSPGDSIAQDDDAASGTVGSTTGTTVTLASSTGTWSPNTGNYVVLAGSGDTEVTGPEKRGEGVFASTNNTDAINLSSTNGEWIDDKNRLGVQFYVVTDNTRMVLGDPRDEAKMTEISLAFDSYVPKTYPPIYFDVNEQAKITELDAIRRYGIDSPDKVNVFNMVDYHPEYEPHSFVRVRDTYVVVHDLYDQFNNIRTAVVTTPKTYIVTVSNGKYFIDGVETQTLTLAYGNTYRFDQSDASNTGHALLIYEDAGKVTQVTDGVTTEGTAGSEGAYTQYVPPVGAPATLYYQCVAHSNMGGQLNIS